MAKNSAPKQLLERDLVISRPVLDLPEDFQYPDGQSARARSLAEIFVEPPTEFLMGLIRGDEDMKNFLSIIHRRKAKIYPGDLTKTVTNAFRVQNPQEQILFHGPRLAIEAASRFGSLRLAQPEIPTSGLSLTKKEANPMGESFIPPTNSIFLKLNVKVY